MKGPRSILLLPKLAALVVGRGNREVRREVYVRAGDLLAALFLQPVIARLNEWTWRLWSGVPEWLNCPPSSTRCASAGWWAQRVGSQ